MQANLFFKHILHTKVYLQKAGVCLYCGKEEGTAVPIRHMKEEINYDSNDAAYGLELMEYFWERY